MIITDNVNIWLDEESKKWYTTARTNNEAMEVCRVLVFKTGKRWGVTKGPLHWKTSKPVCYRIERVEAGE